MTNFRSLTIIFERTVEEDVSYTGSDDIFGFVGKMLSKKEFPIKDLLKKPLKISCKWRAAAANLLQILMLKPLILRSKPKFPEKKECLFLTIQSPCYKTVEK